MRQLAQVEQPTLVRSLLRGAATETMQGTVARPAALVDSWTLT